MEVAKIEWILDEGKWTRATDCGSGFSAALFGFLWASRVFSHCPDTKACEKSEREMICCELLSFAARGWPFMSDHEWVARAEPRSINIKGPSSLNLLQNLFFLLFACHCLLLNPVFAGHSLWLSCSLGRVLNNVSACYVGTEKHRKKLKTHNKAVCKNCSVPISFFTTDVCGDQFELDFL